MSNYLELEGKRALVTGGTKGVGAAVAGVYLFSLREGEYLTFLCVLAIW